MPPRRSPSRRRYIGWHNDSASKRSRSSEALVLTWLTTPGNYARWRTQQRGPTADSESRSALCSEVNALLHSNGIQHRKDRDIYNKIQAMEKSFLAAKRWLQETGLIPAADKRTKTSKKQQSQSPDNELEPFKVAAAVSTHPEALQAVLRAVEEERVHRETLFQLECDKLLQELEKKKVKVAFETALARKKLLDAGVSQDEIDRILPV
uniref:Uncharacterized protein n=1 Tax=Globisporangium ultimum (strain ATCC 200006 / CBS 805.95 / DAOM BR144) TaxID=431595 RepID=K3WL05_GLOUD